MAGWGEALLVLGGAGAGGFKAAGEVAGDEVKTGRQRLLQLALDKRAENLRRFQADENKLSREASTEAARIKASEPGAFEKKYNFLVKELGKAKTDSLIEASFEKTQKGATAKEQLGVIIEAYRLKDIGAPLENINQLLRIAGVEEWVAKKVTRKEKHWYGDKDVEEETYGPPEKKGLLGGVAEEPEEPTRTSPATPDKRADVSSKFDQLLTKINAASSQPAASTEQGGGLVASKETQPAATYQRGSLTRPKEKSIDIEDMANTIKAGLTGVEKVGDALGIVEKWIYDSGVVIGDTIKNGLVWAVKKMIESQSKARKETFGE